MNSSMPKAVGKRQKLNSLSTEDKDAALDNGTMSVVSDQQAQSKRANFSALQNGSKPPSTFNLSKPGDIKKIVIKNIKSN